MKRLLSLVCLVSLTSIGFSQARYQDTRKATVSFDGRELRFSRNAQPYFYGNTPMVPLRELADHMQIHVHRSDSGNDLELTTYDDRVEYRKGRDNFRLNGRLRTLREKSQEREGILFVDMEIFRSLSRRPLYARNDDDYRPGGGWGGSGGSGSGNWGGGGSSNWNSDWEVTFRGRTANFKRNEEVFRRGLTIMMPGRATASFIGARFDRSESGNTIVIRYDGRMAEYRKGDRHYILDGRRIAFSGRSEEKDDILFLPLEIFSGLTRDRLQVRRDR